MLNYRSIRALVVASLVLAAASAVVGKGALVFRVRDDCDPTTFNAALGDGVCNAKFDGGTTFAEFLEELGDDKTVGPWRFNPDQVEIDRGQGTLFESRGGETHTCTRVGEFGGGVVPVLNDLGGFGATRPECGTPELPAPPSTTNLVIPAGDNVTGPTAGGTDLPKGTTKWQCCIHPWMRSTVKVR
jgi:hypothetical protein